MNRLSYATGLKVYGACRMLVVTASATILVAACASQDENDGPGGTGGTAGSPTATTGGQPGVSAGAGGQTSNGGATPEGGSAGQQSVGGEGGSSNGGSFEVPRFCVAAASGTGNHAFCVQRKSFEDAQADCESVDMHLVRIDDAQENSWLAEQAQIALPGTGKWWIGLQDPMGDGFWRWQDGTEDLVWVEDVLANAGGAGGLSNAGGTAGVSVVGGNGGAGAGDFGGTGLFATWRAESGPDGSGDCAQLRDDATWDDTECTKLKSYICEAE